MKKDKILRLAIGVLYAPVFFVIVKISQLITPIIINTLISLPICEAIYDKFRAYETPQGVLCNISESNFALDATLILIITTLIPMVIALGLTYFLINKYGIIKAMAASTLSNVLIILGTLLFSEAIIDTLYNLYNIEESFSFYASVIILSIIFVIPAVYVFSYLFTNKKSPSK